MTKKKNEKSWEYYTDKPISTIEEDKLDRFNFSKLLGDTIINLPKSKNSLSIGLMGGWGYGKTSILNMFAKYIENEDSDSIILWFNPWFYSNYSDLILIFFNELIAKLKEVNSDNELISFLNEYKRKIAKYFLYGLSDVIGLVPGLNSSLLRKIGDDIDSKMSIDETLLELKGKISKKMQNLDKKLIIIMDDIDRLSKDEIFQIFQLIKVVYDFPQVVYILSFDKEHVINAIMTKENNDKEASERYLEKIIQIPLEIPKISNFNIKTIFIEQVNLILESQNLSIDYSLSDLFDYIKFFFKNLRDINRYCNSLNFYLTILKDNVYIPDFILLHSLQVFSPKEYNFIKDNKDFFIGNPFLDDLDDEIYNKEHEEGYFEKFKDSTLPHIKEILRFLFPKLCNTKKVWDDLRLDIANRRLYTSECFDSYFELSLSDNVMSKEDL